MIIHCVNQTACERDRKLCRLSSSSIKKGSTTWYICGVAIYIVYNRACVCGIDIIYGDMRPTNWQHNKL